MPKSNHETGSLQFEIMKPSHVMTADRYATNLLEGVHFATVFPELTLEEARAFGIASQHDSWRNPDKAGLRGHYSRPRVGFARVDDEITHMVYMANNTSAPPRIPGIAGAFVARAALYAPVDYAKEHRYVRIREMIGDDDVVLGALGILLLEEYGSEQPVSDWPYEEETELQDRVRIWGLKQDLDVEESVEYGEDDRLTTNQYFFRAKSVYGVMGHILSVEGVPEMVEYARTTLPPPPQIQLPPYDFGSPMTNS